MSGELASGIGKSDKHAPALARKMKKPAEKRSRCKFARGRNQAASLPVDRTIEATAPTDHDMPTQPITSNPGAAVSPRKRKELDPKSKDFSVRFALHLRGLLDERKLTAAGLLTAVNKAGLDVSAATVKAWLAAARLPRVEDLQAIGRVLKLVDYREVLPPPK